MENSDSLAKAKQRRAELDDAITELEKAVSMAASGAGWRRAVEESLTRLRAAIDAHATEVEGPEGLLAQLAVDAPRLSSEVELMKREHARLLVDTDVILADVADTDADDIRDRAMSLLGDLVTHRQTGADLVDKAYSTDIGGQS